MGRFRVGLAALLIVIPHSASHSDDGGAWLKFQYQLPIWGRSEKRPAVIGRLTHETRFSSRVGGLSAQLFRLGPKLRLNRWFYFAVQGVIVGRQEPNERFAWEYRLELEPGFSLPIWHFVLENRNRIEYRWFADEFNLRYRNRVTLTYARRGASWIPWVQAEFMFEAAGGYDQNRLQTGVGRALRNNIRLDLSYLWIRREEGPSRWRNEYIGVLSLLIDVPAGN